MKRAIFPGTFDPITVGHYGVVKRGLAIFDEIVVGIGNNRTKKTLFSLEDRIEFVKQAFADESRVKVESYDCLTVDFAKQMDADFILRGLRSVTDFEYEHSIADANRKLSGLETVLLFTEYEYSYISSTVVRDLILYGKDISAFLPANVKNPFLSTDK